MEQKILILIISLSYIMIHRNKINNYIVHKCIQNKSSLSIFIQVYEKSLIRVLYV